MLEIEERHLLDLQVIGSDVRLGYAGKEMDPSKTLRDYNIEANATIYTLGRLAGTH